MDCKNCKHNYKPRSCEPKCSRMCENYSDYEPITNADRIRQMTDEELAEFMLKVNTAYAEPCMVSGGDCKYEDYPTRDKGCKDCFLEYLRKEVEEENG